MTNDQLLPDTGTQKQILESKLEQNRQQHYALVIEEQITQVQNPGDSAAQKEQHSRSLKNLRTQIENAKAITRKLIQLRDELPDPPADEPAPGEDGVT